MTMGSLMLIEKWYMGTRTMLREIQVMGTHMINLILFYARAVPPTSHGEGGGQAAKNNNL